MIKSNNSLPDNLIKDKMEELETKINVTENLKTITTISYIQKRYKIIYYNGRIEYTEWKEVENTRKTETTEKKKEKIGEAQQEERTRTIEIGQVVRNAHEVDHLFHSSNIHAQLYIIKQDITERRIIQWYSDGSKEISEWEIIHTKEYELFKENIIRKTWKEIKALTKNY